MNEYKEHISVFRDECINFLTQNHNPSEENVFADLTFGAGGHTMALANWSECVKIIAVDQDPDAIKNGKALIENNNLDKKINLYHSNFKDFPTLYEKELLPSLGRLKGILMDLGVSSHQFDDYGRGFSFRADAPLDMRMNYTDDNILTAADIVNTYSKDELERIFFDYGEERFTKRIVANLLEVRTKKRIETTKELEEIIFVSYPKKLRHGRVHPATRCFQALRIEVNAELNVLSDVIPRLMPLLATKARLAVISFHSLEDRIVKRSFRELAKSDPSLKILTKRPLVPSESEIGRNSRARSAKLRVIEKI